MLKFNRKNLSTKKGREWEEIKLYIRVAILAAKGLPEDAPEFERERLNKLAIVGHELLP